MVFSLIIKKNKLTTHIMDRFITKKRTREELDSNDETTSCEKKCPVNKKKVRPNRKYDENYLAYGFT